MSRVEAWCFHGANALVAFTGCVYAWMCYFATSDDPYAIVNHPLQPQFQHLHVLAAPLLVFATGVLWSRHAWPRVRSLAKPRRTSGVMLIAAMAPLAASGYLLQTAQDESWRAAWMYVHLATSVAWLVGSAAHWIASVRATRRVHSLSIEDLAPRSTRG